MNNLSIILPSVILSLTLFFFGPSQIYFTNTNEFSHFYTEITPFLIITTTFSTFLIFSVLFFLKKFKNLTYLNIGISLVLTISLLFWLQGNFIVWNYGTFNGQPIPWDKYVYRSIIDTLIWMIAIFFAVLNHNFLNKVSNKLIFSLIIIQVVNIGYLGFLAGSPPSFKRFTIDNSEKFTFSNKKNVLIILLDAVQSDVFSQVLDENESYRDIFQGFYYYPDTVGGYPTTYLSIPLIMTGNYYKNETSIENYMKKNYSNKSILSSLKKEKFNIGVYQSSRTFFYDSKLIDSVRLKTKPLINMAIKSNIAEIYNATFFRYLPSSAKKYINTERNWVATSNQTKTNNSTVKQLDVNLQKASIHIETIKFINEFNNSINVSSNIRPTFKYFHIAGAHAPYYLTKELEIKQLENNLMGYTEQVRAMMTFSKKILDVLKSKDIFDNSLIIILGDHGAGFSIDSDKKGGDNLISDFTKYGVPNLVSGNIRSAANPLLLIKPINSKKDLKTIEMQASLSDLPKTILNSLKIKNSFTGMDLLNFDEINTERARIFFSYSWSNENWEDSHLPALNEYVIQGDSRLISSWKPTYYVYSNQKGKEKVDYNKYIFGTKIEFGARGNSNYFLMGGWSEANDNYSWTDEQTSSMRLLFPEIPNRDIKLTAKLSPLFEQKVYIYLNKEKIGEWYINANKEYMLNISKKYLKEKEVLITFYMPDANKSPKELGINQDMRKLGLAFEYFILN